MKAAGIIVEYNPMHNGHIYHIKETRRITNCDILIAVMSGNFVNRGEVSVFDKFSKTELALQNGVDLVIELPFYYVNQSADKFALGAISILNELKCQDIVFGSEKNDLNYLSSLVSKKNTPEFKDKLQASLDEGLSYSKATRIALDAILDPNDILGFCYLNTIKELSSIITPHLIKRIGGYNSLESNNSLASAKALRETRNLIDFVPNNVLTHYQNNSFRTTSEMFPFIKYNILSKSSLELSKIRLVDEGIEGAIGKAPLNSYDELVNYLSSKRYTNTRIKRMLLNILGNISKGSFMETNPYIRVLGMNEKGQGYLATIKDTVNIISKVKEGINPLLDLELKMSKIYSLLDKDIYEREFKKPIIMK